MRPSSFLAVVFALFLTARAGAQVSVPAPLEQMQESLRTAGADAPGVAAYAVRDLVTGYTSGYNMDAVMPAASTIKIPIMVEVFKQMAAGNFDLNRRVELFASDRDWGSGDICDSPVGSTFTVSTLLTQMITVSDNTAANMLIRLVGRSSINAEMTDLGLNHTHLSDYIHTEEWSVRTSLRTTPADMVRLLTDMAKNNLIDAWSSRQMIAILEHQEINTLLPAPLPDIPIAHKTGSFDDTLNDVGIVYGEEPYVIAVMTTDLSSLDAGRDFIHHISRVAYTRMEQFAHWRTENGLDTSVLPDAEAATQQDQTTQGAPPTAQADGDAADASVQQDVPMWGSPAPAATP
jgi:beta-lactamase class A